MKKYLLLSLIILTAGTTLNAKPEVRFKDKNISSKYDKKIDAMIYSGKWERRNPFEVRIIEYGDKAGDLSGTAWLEITIARSGNGYVGMEYVRFSYEGGERERINLDSVQGTVNFNIRANTFGDFWTTLVTGEIAKQWIDKIIKLSNGANSLIAIYGSGAFSDGYVFRPKDKASLKALGEAWLKYFAE